MNRQCGIRKVVHEMFEKKEARCEYLAANDRSCTAVTEGEGLITRDQQCSGPSKDLCCYLCNKRSNCEIGCTYLDSTTEENETKKPQLSSVTSPKRTNETFTCPVCGAPHDEPIPVGIIEVKCRYCGANARVPPCAGENAPQCPNHPDAIALGICNDCGRSFCDRCLYTFNVRDGTLYVCPDCYKERKSSGLLGWGIVAALGLVIVFLGLVGLAKPQTTSTSPGVFVVMTLFGILFFTVVVIGARWSSNTQPISVHDSREQNP